MDVLSNRIARLATYMPLGSYVIYTALQTLAFSFGPSPESNLLVSLNTTIEKSATTSNYTCSVQTYPSFSICNDDQKQALIVALAVGFFMSGFLSFVKRVPSPSNSAPSLPNKEKVTIEEDLERKLEVPDNKKSPARRGIIHALGSDYYMDFGSHLIWGHALLSVISFGTITLFSSPVSYCLFPSVKGWIFVMLQLAGLIICTLIGMFWIKDPSLGIETSVYTVRLDDDDNDDSDNNNNNNNRNNGNNDDKSI